MKKLLSYALFCGLLPLSAQALTAEQSVLKEVKSVNAQGEPVVSYEPADLVVPGETVIYRLDYQNDGADPVSNLVLTMPVPEQIAFIEGSADRSGANVTYSADNGRNFSNRSSLKVTGNGGQSVAATSEDITHIRWTLTDIVAPDGTGYLSFEGKLK